jgi:hypothetical protein
MPKRDRANIGNPGRLLTNSYEQSAGRKSAPDSRKGILATWERENFRTFCKNHSDALQTVIDVSNDIKQLPTCAIYDAQLSCGCRKSVVINIRRPVPKPMGEPTGEELAA